MSSEILSPSALGVTGNGNLDSLGKDVTAVMTYLNSMWDGHGYHYTPIGQSEQVKYATASHIPIGSVYFYKTDQMCKIEGTDQQTNRYLFIDNQPYNDPNSPVGILPGIVHDIVSLNPEKIIDGVLAPVPPPCRNVSLRVVNNGNYEYQSNYVALMDLPYIDPRLCEHSGCTNTSNKESFVNLISNNTSTINNIIINIIIIIIVILIIIKLNS